ncbi:MAG: BCCT family transporter [Candidatus Competibacteraceae bacterium]
MLAVIFGLAGSLTMGILGTLRFDRSIWHPCDTHTVSIIILALMTVTFLLSASTGVDKGIKILSNINMIVAVSIMLVVIFLAPRPLFFRLSSTPPATTSSQLLTFPFGCSHEGLDGWTQSWTLTYFIWWLAQLLVGIFIARISRGRTLRQFCIGVILLPTLFSMLWFAAFGGAGFYIEMYGGGGIAGLIFEDVNRALFALLGYWLSGVLNVLAVFLIFIFLVTSADSGTLSWSA